MTLTADQIDSLVRVVIERLRAKGIGLQVDASPQSPTLGLTENHAPEASSVASEPVDAGQLQLDDRVITLESLKGRLNSVTALVVHPKAVVTPAVKDEVRRLGIKIVRKLAWRDQSVVQQPRILLVCPSEQVARYGRFVCSRQSTVMGDSQPTTTVSAIESHLTQPNRFVVWCTSHPFSAMAHTFGHPRIRSVQLPALADLGLALHQAAPNVIVVHCRDWTVHAVANLVRQWHGRSK